MSPTSLLLLLLLVFLLGFLIYFAKLQGVRTEQMRRELENLREEIRDDLRRVENNMGNTGTTLADVRVNLARLQQSLLDIREISKDMVKLKDILRPPKERGILGEWMLENLLSDILPSGRYALQYRFSDGTQVDAVIFLRERILPIDSKFPLDNFYKMGDAEDPKEKEKLQRHFRRDVKNRIEEISGKYIKPAEKTLNFALLYIPAEGVYYEAFIRDAEAAELYRYAVQRKVIPVSPNTFYAFLELILSGLSGLELEEKIEEILQTLSTLGMEVGKLEALMRTLGAHLKNAGDKFQEAKNQLERISSLIHIIGRPDG